MQYLPALLFHIFGDDSNCLIVIEFLIDEVCPTLGIIELRKRSCDGTVSELAACEDGCCTASNGCDGGAFRDVRALRLQTRLGDGDLEASACNVIGGRGAGLVDIGPLESTPLRAIGQIDANYNSLSRASVQRCHSSKNS
ncbi:MAG: hypothetical protein R3D51_17865 [Hyphomicrobiaceae bacterium]